MRYTSTHRTASHSIQSDRHYGEFRMSRKPSRQVLSRDSCVVNRHNDRAAVGIQRKYDMLYLRQYSQNLREVSKIRQSDVRLMIF